MSFIEELKKQHEQEMKEIRAERERLAQEEYELEEAYLATGLGCTIPIYHLGFRPACVERYGGVFKVYRDCLKKGVSWQELCHWDPNNEPAGHNM